MESTPEGGDVLTPPAEEPGPAETPAPAASGPLNAEMAAKKAALLEFLAILHRRGHVSLDEVAAALDRPSLDLPEELKIIGRRIADLETEVRLERASREFAEEEALELETALNHERELVTESLERIAHLETQLQDARRTTVKLIAASKSSLSDLKKVRSELHVEAFAQEALNPLVRDLQQMVVTVQELHSLALVKGATPPAGPGPANP